MAALGAYPHVSCHIIDRAVAVRAERAGRDYASHSNFLMTDCRNSAVLLS